MVNNHYAAHTTVTAERSWSEIESLLVRYGADRFAYSWEGDRRIVGFRIRGRMVKLTLNLPSATDHDVIFDSSARRRPAGQRANAREQMVRQRWRALVLVLQAKLEAVASGISTMEDEFLATTLLPDGRTVGEWVRPSVTAAYELGEMPTALMLGAGKGKDERESQS